MSLDLFQIYPPCPTCNHETDGINLNITYNCAPMWYAIYPDAKAMVDIDGLTGEEANPIIKHALVEFRKNRDKFEALNPVNGWGNAKVFKQFLVDVLIECVKHPDLAWGSDR